MYIYMYINKDNYSKDGSDILISQATFSKFKSLAKKIIQMKRKLNIIYIAKKTVYLSF